MSKQPIDYTNAKLKRKLVEIKNKDKGWTEKWTPNRASDSANFPHPSRIALIGPPSVGKSFIMKHLLLHQRPMFKELYIIHGDSDCTKEFDDMDPTMMMSDFPPIEFFDGAVKTLLIIDDVEFHSLSKDQMSRLNKIVRYVSSHKNVTVYISHQSFFDLPSLVRKLCNVFIIWKPRSVMELQTIANRVGLSAKALNYIYENICTEYRDSLCIDHNINTPSFLRKNLWEPFKLPPEFQTMSK
jgi:hypothetical protein